MMTGKAERVVGLDLLRGAAVAGMIVVDSPGDWGHVYAPLLHADWNGWTPTDMIFPTFLFSVGMALGLSFPRRWSGSDRAVYFKRVARRVIALIVLGVAIEATFNLAIAIGAIAHGDASLSHLRLPGILQRIALCYGLVAALLAVTGRRDPAGTLRINSSVVALIIAIILIGYWALLSFVPVPGFGAGRLDQAGSLTAFVDRVVFTPPHMWVLGWATPGGPPVYDPEGLLSTLPAATNTLFGVLAATLWRREPARAPLLIAVAGCVLIVGGLLLDPMFVINKRLWTSSFALFSSGVSALVLVALAFSARSAAAGRLLAPVKVLGGNAILAFTLTQLLGRVFGAPLLPGPHGRVAPVTMLQQLSVAAVGDPKVASLICALLTLALIVALVAPLHRRGLHLRL